MEDNGGCRCGPGLDSCLATCLNLNGSYFCVCSDDTLLDSDKLTCVGMNVIIIILQIF